MVLHAMADGGFAVWEPARNDQQALYPGDLVRISSCNPPD
jgi:hypothetical protein